MVQLLRPVGSKQIKTYNEMELFPDLKKRYTEERFSAREAQRMAEVIAWGPIVFQA